MYHELFLNFLMNKQLRRSDIIALLYLIIGLTASVFGALAGLGGGIIIKPVLDLIGQYDVASVGILSAATVFSMSCVSLFNSTKLDVKINVKSSLVIAAGSIIGGVLGKWLFNILVHEINAPDKVKLIQAIMIGLLMVIIYMFVKNKQNIKTYHLSNAFVIFAIGLCLGNLAAFLGIGGGPLNVAILAFCFSMSARESALNSIFIIFFSQLSALIFTAFSTGFSQFDLSMLPYMIIGGVSGGLIGSKLARKVKDAHVEKIFTVGIVLIILINVANVVGYFY